MAGVRPSIVNKTSTYGSILHSVRETSKVLPKDNSTDVLSRRRGDFVLIEWSEVIYQFGVGIELAYCSHHLRFASS